MDTYLPAYIAVAVGEYLSETLIARTAAPQISRE